MGVTLHSLGARLSNYKRQLMRQLQPEPESQEVGRSCPPPASQWDQKARISRVTYPESGGFPGSEGGSTGAPTLPGAYMPSYESQVLSPPASKHTLDLGLT